MKKKNQILVSLSIVALLGGCSEEQVQRDVYQSLDDCLADWKKLSFVRQIKILKVLRKLQLHSSRGWVLNIRDNGNAESAVKNPAENNAQANPSENRAGSTTKAESADPSLGARNCWWRYRVYGGSCSVVVSLVSSWLSSWKIELSNTPHQQGKLLQPQTDRSVAEGQCS